MNSVIAKLSLTISLAFLSTSASGAVISLPENELPSESVLPTLDNRTVVLNRTIQKSQRVSVGTSFGNMFDEMFYNARVLSMEVRYNNSEMSGWGLRWDQWTGGATTYNEAFANDVSRLQFSLAPYRKSGAFLTRNFDLYYGKVSLGKEVVFPIQLSWLAMLGAQNYESDWLPALQGGGEIKLYLTKNTALDLKYIFSAYQKVDPTSTNVREENGIPLKSAFEKKLSFGQIFQVGVSYLF